MIKSGLLYSITDLSSNIEALTAQALLIKGKTLTIVNIIINMYVPPTSEFIAENYKDLISKSSSLIVGDLNAYSPLWCRSCITALVSRCVLRCAPSYLHDLCCPVSVLGAPWVLRS